MSRGRDGLGRSVSKLFIERQRTLVSALYSIQLRKHLVIGQFNFSAVFATFHWSPPIGTCRMTPVTFVKTMDSYELCRSGHHLGSTFTGTDQYGRA